MQYIPYCFQWQQLLKHNIAFAVFEYIFTKYKALFNDWAIDINMMLFDTHRVSFWQQNCKI